MPDPEKVVWRAHPVHGQVEYQRRTAEFPASVFLLCELDTPNTEKGRLVRVEFRHEYVIAALVNELLTKVRDRGHSLPDTMG